MSSFQMTFLQCRCLLLVVANPCVASAGNQRRWLLIRSRAGGKKNCKRLPPIGIEPMTSGYFVGEALIIAFAMRPTRYRLRHRGDAY